MWSVSDAVAAGPRFVLLLIPCSRCLHSPICGPPQLWRCALSPGGSGGGQSTSHTGHSPSRCGRLGRKTVPFSGWETETEHSRLPRGADHGLFPLYLPLVLMVIPKV